MAVGSIVARILTQYSDKGSKAAQKDILKLGKNFDAFSKKAIKSFGIAAAASAAFAAKIGVDAVKAALEDQKSQVVLANSLRNTVGASDAAIASIESYISKQQLLVNVSDTALRPSLAALVVVTKNLTEAQNLQAIALDTSAATGRDLETVTLAIVKAANGNIGALKKLGIPLSDNIVKTKDFNGAMQMLQDTYGGTAKKLADTDPLLKLKLAYGELLETLGYGLLPVIKEFANYIITNVLPVVQSWVDLNKDKLAASLKDATDLMISFGKTVFGFIDYISRNLTTIKVFATIVAGIFVASKVYAFATAIGLLIPAFAALASEAGIAGAAVALATGGVSVGAATIALGAFAVTVGAVSVKALTAGKYVEKADAKFEHLGRTHLKLSQSILPSSVKVLDKFNSSINTSTNNTKKLTAEQILSLKVQKQLQEQFGVKATSETDPIQLEAARLNLIKQQNLAIQAVDASYLAFIEKQMKANENAQRYADILAAIKDGKITTEEIDNLAKAWGIPREAVIAYITKVTGLAQSDFSGLDAPGLAAASGWDAALKKLNEYFDALKKGSTPAPSGGGGGGSAGGSLGGMTTAVETIIGPNGKEFTDLVDGIAQVYQTVQDSGAFNALVNTFANGAIGSFNAGSLKGSEGSISNFSGGGAFDKNSGVTNIFNITTVDPTKAGDAVVDAINNSANIRGGYTGIGLSRAVTIL